MLFCCLEPSVSVALKRAARDPADLNVPLLAFASQPSDLSSTPGTLLFLCTLGLGAGVYFFVRGFFLLQRRRLIVDTPFSKIRSASMGLVELSGLAVGPYTMPAPITGRPCYYYRSTVSEYKQCGKSKEWVTVAGECLHLPFFLDDNTGRVLVDPRGAELDIHRDFHQEFCDSFFSTKDPAPDSVRSFLARQGINTRNKIRVDEFCIKPKNALFILGTLAENPGLELTSEPSHGDLGLSSQYSVMNAASFLSVKVISGDSDELAFAQRLEQPSISSASGAQHEVIHLSSGKAPEKAADMTQQQKIVAALLKAGIANPMAWAAADAGASPVQVSADNPGGFDPHPHVVLMKGENAGAFLISWRSQQEVARRMGWKCAAMIFGGPALIIASLWLLLNHWTLL